MSKGTDPMNFDDLGTVYRTEKKSPSISSVRKDLYPAMAGLITDLRTEYEKQLSVDSESIMCEGANQRRKKAISLSKEVTELRMGKIASLALIGARGGQNSLNNLTQEERLLYEDILTITKKHVLIVDRLSGKRKYETPEIDSEPAAEKHAPAPAAETNIPRIKQTEEPDIEEFPPAEEETRAEERPEPAAVEKEEYMVIRILEDLPPFSGPDRNYTLSKEDIVRMPKTMALVLIGREKAVLISPGP